MRKQKRKFRLKRKAWVEPEMMESEPFRSLSGTAIWILLRFRQKQSWSEMRQGGRNVKVYENKGLTFTYTEANYFGISDSTFYRSIKTLVQCGFLDVEHRGGTFGHGKIKDYTTFNLSDRWRLKGKPEFVEKDFPRFKHRGADVQARKEWKEAFED